MNKPLSEVLSSKKLSEADMKQIDNALKKLSDYPIYLDDSSNTTPESIKTSVQQLISSGNPPRLIIVDYLQLIHLKEMSGRSRYEEVTAISNQLKRLAKELKVPIPISITQMQSLPIYIFQKTVTVLPVKTPYGGSPQRHCSMNLIQKTRRNRKA